MSILYPRTITITRPNAPASSASGLLPYQGLTEANETTLVSGVPAQIAITSTNRSSNAAGLPPNSPGPIKWKIVVPAMSAILLPLIEERDVIYDDLGRRFQADAYEIQPLCAVIDAVRLTA